MTTTSNLGDFEQLVLLAILQLGPAARAAAVRARVEEAAERSVSRGALYATLDRLAAKGFLDWRVEDAAPARGGIPSRRFQVTRSGVVALRRAVRAVTRLSEGLEGVLEGGR